jgi:hypothetical protein
LSAADPAAEKHHMKVLWAATIALIGLMSGSALAQTTAPEPTRVANGPAGTVEQAHAGIVVDSTGAATGTSDTFKKTQSYTSGDGQLSARTKIQTTGPTTTIEK